MQVIERQLDTTESRPRGATRPGRGGHWIWMLALILVGLGAKLRLIGGHGSPPPYLDRWEGEGAAIYVPYLEHQLSTADFFRPHNEHRIVFTNIYNLALLVLN